MQARVVVYDPDGVLPASFARDAGLDDVITPAGRAADAQRMGRDASILVLVAGGDDSAALGILASLDEASARLVLVATDARYHRRVLIRAGRRGATVLIGQHPSVLAACLRELLVPHPLSREAERACRALASSLSPRAVAFLLLAAGRATPDVKARDLARALGISARTFSRRVRATELGSVTELVMLGRLMRAVTLAGPGATQQLRARVGGFRSVGALRHARRHLLSAGRADDPLAALRHNLAHGVTLNSPPPAIDC